MRRSCIIVAVLLLPFAVALSYAQHSFSVEAETVPNQIRLKLSGNTPITLESVQTLFAIWGPQYKVESITPWIRPELINSYSHSLSFRSHSSEISALQKSLNGLQRIVVVQFANNYDMIRLAAKLQFMPAVEYAEPIWKRKLTNGPNDLFLAEQFYLQQLHANEAWEIARADATIVIGVIDSGIDPEHPDLKRALWVNPGESGKDDLGRDRRMNGQDDDGNGIVDDWQGYDFAGYDGTTEDNNPRASFAHGVHVAGIAAATGDNSEGVAGVGFGASILPIKITADTGINDPDLVRPYEAILYAGRMGAKIVNCSWGGYGYSRAEQEVINAVTEMGTLVIAAAGNQGRGVPSYPAAYRNVISVGSVSLTDQRSGFSNYHETVDIVAPGEDILSTIPVAFGSYGRLSGTSMAAPMVAGAAALVLARYGSLTPEQLGAILKSAADDIYTVNPQFTALLGAGRLNVVQSLEIGPNIVYAEITDQRIRNTNGNNNLNPGDNFNLEITLRNLLAPSLNLQVEISILGDYPVQLLDSIVSFAGVSSGTTITNNEIPFRFLVSETIPFDQVLPVQFTVRENQRVVSITRRDLLVNPSYATTRTTRLAVTLSGNGRIGYVDFPRNQYGQGFSLDGSSNLLAEGGLLVGRSADAIADVIRNSRTREANADIQTLSPFRVHRETGSILETGSAKLTGKELESGKNLGVEIDLQTYAYATPGRDRQVLLLYTFTNTSDTPIEDLHAALFLDWDLGVLGRNNRTMFDPHNRMGYTLNVFDNRWPVTAAVLVSDHLMNFTALDSHLPPLTDDFSKEEKWQSMSTGIRVQESQIGDNAMLIGAGPLSIAPGESTVVAFALMAGENVEDIQEEAAEVRALYRELGFTPGGPVVVPEAAFFAPAEPNPFIGKTTLQYQIPEENDVRLEIVGLDGRVLQTLVDQPMRQGVYSVAFTPPNDMITSIWIARLQVGSQTFTQKLIYLGQQ